MTITIRETNVTGSIIFQTTASVDGRPPTIYFRNDSFQKTPDPKWVTQFAPEREGDFKFYNGSGDTGMSVVVCLWGDSRNANLAQILTMGTKVFYLTDGDVDSNNDGQYVVTTKPQVRYKPEIDKIEITMNWESYNN